MTKVTFTNKGKSPHKDNLDNLKGAPKFHEEELKELLKDPDNGVFHVTEDETYPCSVLNYKGNKIIFPEPNPVSFFYSLAKGASTDFNKVKDWLDQFYKDKSSLPTHLQYDTVIFSYIFKIGSAGIIFSFSAIEAILNQLIPDEFTITRKNKKLTKIEVQRYFNFEEKYKIVVQETGKDFKAEHQEDFEIISNDLKVIRNELMHLKNNKERHLTYYTKIYQDVLDLDLQRIVKSTKDFCNYYLKEVIKD